VILAAEIAQHMSDGLPQGYLMRSRKGIIRRTCGRGHGADVTAFFLHPHTCERRLTLILGFLSRSCPQYLLLCEYDRTTLGWGQIPDSGRSLTYCIRLQLEGILGVSQHCLIICHHVPLSYRLKLFL
jgi:hypothetical protein